MNIIYLRPKLKKVEGISNMKFEQKSNSAQSLKRSRHFQLKITNTNSQKSNSSPKLKKVEDEHTKIKTQEKPL